MEVRSNRNSPKSSRTRVLVAVLAMGLIVGAFGYSRAFNSDKSASTPESASGPNSSSPVEGEEEISSSPSTGISPRPVGQLISASPSRDQLSTAWKQSTTRLKYLDHCSQTDNCAGFDSSEPSSYDIDVNRQTAREIEDFTRLAQVWAKERGLAVLPEEAQTVARYFLANGNDDVKDAALKLLDLAPVNQVNLSAALSALKTSASAPLMRTLATTELVKNACGQQSFAPTCLAFVKERNQHGGEYLQRMLAKHSLAFTNEYTLAYWKQQERSVSPRSIKAQYLRANNHEAEMMAKGG